MVVAVQVSVSGIISTAGIAEESSLSAPPQMIISLPVQTAVCSYRPAGAFVVRSATQVLVPGLYLPPVFNEISRQHRHRTRSFHYQSIRPCEDIAPLVAFVELIAVQVLVRGIVSPACVRNPVIAPPPHTIISLPVQTAV